MRAWVNNSKKASGGNLNSLAMEKSSTSEVSKITFLLFFYCFIHVHFIAPSRNFLY